MKKYPVFVLDENADEFTWDDETGNLTYELKGKKSFTGFWRVNGKNMGWRNLSGKGYFEADNGKDFIFGFVPECDFHLTIFRNKNGYEAKLFHHDSPTGEEYIIRPVSEETYYKNN